MRTTILISTLCLSLAACAGPKPVLYPNNHLAAVGDDQADQDIDQCQELAEAAGASDGGDAAGNAAKSTVAGGAIGAGSGAVAGAIGGNVGRGAMIGAAVGATAGLLRAAFSRPRPGQAHMNYVNRCLSDRGYETVGWD
ncbi:MAG: hypothetical protein GY791_01930 [Alphaproteobacteria bacterium]|nr:hypothetical protein [Alphaproteobacteria bacterium]